MDLATLSRDDIAARLAGPAAERAALVRAGAEAGVAEAQAVYGQMLLDAGEAAAGFGWFMRAAAQHHLLAVNMVGRCYDQGWGIAVDKPRAAECFRAAAEAGLDWGMYNYATLLALGDGVAADRPAALGWLERAAALGNAKAINFVGSFHEDGWVVERDLAKAAEYYARAAAGGDFRGAFNHARMLGIDAAEPWLEAAGQGGTPAFVAKAAAWLAASDRPGFATRGLAALRRGAAC